MAEKSIDKAWCWALSPDYTEKVSRKFTASRELFCSASELADFFHVRNIVFFHPGHHESQLLQGLSRFNKVICNIGDPLFLKDAEQQDTKAASFSRLSVSLPNVAGGIVDDFSTAVKEGRMTAKAMKKTYEALKTANVSLRLLAVVYTMHLDLDFSPYLPYMDIINLWVWKSADLMKLDEYMQTAERLFPGKKIHLGLYLHNYGEAGYRVPAPLPLPLLQFQLKRAQEYVLTGRIEGFHLLGSYMKQELSLDEARWVAENI